jgi:RNA polymerase sigma factor (sigma-70 family)
MKTKTSIIIIEDHPEYRDLLAAAVTDHPDMELIHKFGAAEIALRTLQKNPSSPDLILLDLNLPGISGIEALPWLLKQIPDVKIIVLTQSDRETDVQTALASGASGYLLKSSTLDQITEGIQAVMSGGAPIDPKVASYILKTMQTRSIRKVLIKELSTRETEVLTLLSEGLSQKEIADRLNITTRTISTHITHIYEKLNVPNAPAAISKAYQSGLFHTQ